MIPDWSRCHEGYKYVARQEFEQHKEEFKELKEQFSKLQRENSKGQGKRRRKGWEKDGCLYFLLTKPLPPINKFDRITNSPNHENIQDWYTLPYAELPIISVELFIIILITLWVCCRRTQQGRLYCIKNQQKSWKRGRAHMCVLVWEVLVGFSCEEDWFDVEWVKQASNKICLRCQSCDWEISCWLHVYLYKLYS